MAHRSRALLAIITSAIVAAGCSAPGAHVLRMSGSAVGREAVVLRAQLARFQSAHPGLEVELRATPDAADQRHQLYVQWLNAHTGDPDVLQLDVIWTPEFAAAGWILPLDRFRPTAGRFFPAAIAADRWNGRLYALPWFVDVGMLYWRTDLAGAAPTTFEALDRVARRAMSPEVPYGFVWQGARYEGLVTVFQEFLGAFGGQVLDDRGRVAVDSDAAVRALTEMRDEIGEDAVAPQAVLTWQEEQTRFAFQNGQAVFMRNWPYADALLRDASASRVAGRFAVAPMPAGPGGRPTAALGGSQLAINAYTDQADDAYALVEFLLEPAQMLERARLVGQYPPDTSLYDTRALGEALGADPGAIRRIIEGAVPRPVTPVYSELSEILQIALHRALTKQVDPAPALHDAARAMQRVLDDAGLGGGVP